MPTKKSLAKKSKPRRRRRRAKKARAQNLAHNVRWFKAVHTLESNTSGEIDIHVTSDSIGGGPLGPIGDFHNYASAYEEYKVMKVICRFYPMSVGSESLQQQITPGIGYPLFRRGAIASWIDQGNNDSVSGGIPTLINRNSSRIFNPRRFHSRWMTRAPGFPKWGQLDTSGVPIGPLPPGPGLPFGRPNLADAWEAAIRLWGDSFTPSGAQGSQAFFYVQMLFKVVFRGRRE